MNADQTRNMILDRVASKVDSNYTVRADFARDWLAFSGAGLAPPTVVSKLNGTSTVRLRELLSWAEFLNLDLRWLVTGDQREWNEIPRESVRVRIGGVGSIVFDVPSLWPNLNLRLYPDPGESGFLTVERGEEIE